VLPGLFDDDLPVRFTIEMALVDNAKCAAVSVPVKFSAKLYLKLFLRPHGLVIQLRGMVGCEFVNPLAQDELDALLKFA